MPFVHVTSNAARSGVDSSATMRSVAEAAAKALDRPLSHVIVKLDLDQDMFAGESEEVRWTASVVAVNRTSCSR